MTEYYSEALIVEHLGVSWEYVHYELPWFEYFILLAVALDLDERKRYWEYKLAGGRDKDWKWQSSDKAGLEGDSSGMWDRLIQSAPGRMVGDIGNIAQRDWSKVYRIEQEWSDGSVKIAYENERGEDITAEIEQSIASGEQVFMKTNAG